MFTLSFGVVDCSCSCSCLQYAGAPAGSFPSPLPSSASAIRAQQQAAASYATPSSGIQGGGGPSQANATPGMASNSSAATGRIGGEREEKTRKREMER